MAAISAPRGSVSHGFDRLGLIEYPAAAGDADTVFEAAIEAGAEDVESDEDGHEIWTASDDLHEVARRSKQRSARPRASSSPGGRRPPVEVGEERCRARC